ncbi:hypothetical protein [Streptomyces albicerus]|uniref:hypothetical protein n=1 Tax=Streptomyces albicerus TaxID=2569859 RepID=UPI00124B3288|nr:hypothetical protein [Streptomyces albicerus]
MGPAGEWYVLVEHNRVGSEGKWTLRQKLHAEDGREHALSMAQEVTLSCTGDTFRSPAELGRSVFRISETSWLVEIGHSRWSELYGDVVIDSEHVRISVAELAHFTEPPPAEPQPAKVGRLSKVFKRD